jgi:hypothetical protein
MSNVLKKNNVPISAHVARWLSGGKLYVEAEVFDRVLPQKSVLCHYHDQSKGEERGSGQQCLIFSVINPKCVSSNKFGYFCGRLSMDANQPSSYYFTHVLRRVAVDVCRLSKQIPLSALFQRSWNYTPMFDIDVKMSSVKFTDDILSNWGRLIISTVMQFYPGMKWRKGVPFLVCSRPMNQMEGTVEWSCAHCGSKEYNVGSSGSMTIIDCTKCGKKAAPQETTYYKLGAHFDFVQIRTEDCERLYQDIQTMEDGTKLVTGSSMVVNSKHMLVLREALVQKLVTMDPEERATYGLDKNQTDIFGIVDEKIYGSSKMADIPSSMCSGTNGSLRPCFVSKTRDCDCKAFYERYGNTGYDPDCAHCGGEGVRIWKERQYIPTRILDGEGNELPQFQARYSTSPGCDLVCDLLRLTSHHITHDHRDAETPGFVLPEDFQGGVQAASDIEIGPEMTEKDRERNDCLLGVNVSKPSSTSMKRYSIDVSTGKPSRKKVKYSKKQGGGELHFPESTEEGRKIRETIESIIKRAWSPHLQYAYVGNYCMAYTGAKDKKNGNQINANFRTTYVVQVAGQGSGYCSNAKHCVCGASGGPLKCPKCKTKISLASKKARASKGKVKERWARTAKMLRWGMHRQQKSPLYLQIHWTGRDAVVTRKCRSGAIGLDGKACDACEEGTSRKRALEKVTCTPAETVIFYPYRTAKLEQEKTQRKIQEGKNRIVHDPARGNKQQQLNYLMHCQAMFASQFGNK